MVPRSDAEIRLEFGSAIVYEKWEVQRRRNLGHQNLRARVQQLVRSFWMWGAGGLARLMDDLRFGVKADLLAAVMPRGNNP